ncbi:Hypothetical protein PHPALM_37268 [Phytophthora palmivora]|uniref:Uncharacterized protein n=1 Tax=Phytophthora palmivora TaxID=4796 RepID=A0A2P4WXW8_9STRA|nr:Hypothetical protein PHPALM_37268 [Phytophthora palmivora]
MWLNSRDLSGDDDGVAARDGMWGFAGSSQSASHGSIGASGSRALWNRMEPAEEEREEEALPSYLSYLQPAFRPAPTTPTTRVPAAQPPTGFYTAKRGAPGLPTPSPPMPEPVVTTPAMQEMAIQVQALQNQVLELTKNSIPTAIEVGRINVKNSPSNGNWSANAPPFVPKQQYKQQPSPPQAPPPPAVDQSTATVLSDRISTLEGRQSAFQSQLAQIAKVLGIPTGKPGKHSPVKHLVQTLRDEVDVKVQQATAEARTDLTAEINAALGDIATGKASGDTQEALSSNVLKRLDSVQLWKLEFAHSWHNKKNGCNNLRGRLDLLMTQNTSRSHETKAQILSHDYFLMQVIQDTGCDVVMKRMKKKMD